jgi:hypothetical protein
MAKRPYLPREEYAWTYYEAQRQARLFFLPFNEYERLADNDVREDLPPNMPRVNDGSLADLLQKTVMRVLAQPYTGNVKILESIDPKTGEFTYPQPWLREMANYIWSKNIIPHANTQAMFWRKCQLSLYNALKYGSQPIYSFFTSNGSYRGADFTLPYIRDCYLEIGKRSDIDSDYIFLDTYFTRLQLQRVIAQANKLQEIGVKSPWDIEALKKIYNSHLESQKEYLAKNKAERNRPVRATQIKFTTVFQRGVEAPFDTFYAMGNKDQVTIVRSKINEDPTGDVPIHFLYAYETLDNPYGNGQIRMSGGTQNVLDYLTQLHVLATQIGLQPPILVEGQTMDTDIKSMIYAPSQFWFTGGAKVDTMETSSSIYKEFPQALGMYKSTLVNAQGQAPVDVSGESGSPINSKTPKAQGQRAQTLSEYDNYLRGQFYNAFNRVTKSMLNIHFANMQGEDMLRLEADDALKLTRAGLIPADPNNPNMPSSNEVMIDWDHLRGKFDFEIDPDSVIVKENQEQVQQLSEIIDLYLQNPYLAMAIQSTGYTLNIGELYRQLFTKLGLQDIEKILEPLSQEQKSAAAQMPPQVFDKPSISVRYDMLPPAAQQQMLQRLGYNVSMLDVLMGPVLDPNERGVYQPEPEPGDAMNPIGPQALASEQQPGTPPLPPSPQSQIILPNGAQLTPSIDVPQQPGPAAPPPTPTPTPGAPAPGPSPESTALLHKTMLEHGLPQQQALAVMHAKALGIPDEDIQSFMQKNGMGKYGQQPSKPSASQPASQQPTRRQRRKVVRNNAPSGQ